MRNWSSGRLTPVRCITSTGARSDTITKKAAHVPTSKPRILAANYKWQWKDGYGKMRITHPISTRSLPREPNNS